MIAMYELLSRSIFATYNDCEYAFNAHFQGGLEIVYCFSGIQPVRIEDKIYRLKAGETLVIFPDMVHEYIYEGCGQDTRSISIICDMSFLTSIRKDLKDMYPKNPLIEADKIRDETRLAFMYCIDDRIDTLAIVGRVLVIFSDLLKHLEFAPIKNSYDSSVVQKITSYVRRNYAKPLTLEYLSRELGMNKSYLSHVISEKIKINFRQFLNSVRLEEAARKIRSTNDSLIQIAFDTGFGSQRSFNRAFLSVYGVSPSQYKKGIINLSDYKYT